MKKIFFTLFLIFAYFFSFSQEEIETLVAGNNKFAFNLYSQVKKDKENLFFSPFSVSAALAMTYGGAKANTEKQMSSVLNFAANDESFHSDFRRLMNTVLIKDGNDKLQLTVANRIWAQKDYKFLPEFFKLTKEVYDAPAEQVNFIDEEEREKARNSINNWVEEETNKKITELIKPKILTDATRMVLVNAIYFFATWENQFEDENTKNLNFFVDKSTKKEVPFMNKTMALKYIENNVVQGLVLPYFSNKASLLIFLPKENVSSAEFAKSFTFENYKSWILSAKECEVETYIPKFRIEADFDLSEVLKTMGMPEVFTNAADFSGMTGKKDLKISNVIHKSFIQINEKGTEAAAATAVIMSRKSAIFKQLDRKKFLANRPFTFVLVENITNSILFMGSLYDPKK